MPCNYCHLPYPEHLLSPVFGGPDTGPVCAICALAIINEAHGMHRTTFSGEQAERLRQAALAWRIKHPKAQTHQTTARPAPRRPTGPTS